MKSPAAAAFAAAAVLVVIAAPAAAEEGPYRRERPKSAYRADYQIYEVEDGKRVNERAFTLSVVEGSTAVLRAGSRVPIAAEKGPQYLDVGLRITCRVAEREEGDVVLDTDVEQTSFVAEPPTILPATPFLRSLGQSVSTRLAPGKPVLVSRLDDVTTKKRTEVEVTLTRTR